MCEHFNTASKSPYTHSVHARTDCIVRARTPFKHALRARTRRHALIHNNDNTTTTTNNNKSNNNDKHPRVPTHPELTSRITGPPSAAVLPSMPRDAMSRMVSTTSAGTKSSTMPRAQVVG